MNAWPGVLLIDLVYQMREYRTELIHEYAIEHVMVKIPNLNKKLSMELNNKFLTKI